MKWLTASQAGRAWLDALPRILSECIEQWRLRISAPFPYAFASLALPAELPGGKDAVLKIQFPGRESEFEAAALAYWAGDGAVQLIAHDPQRHALLVERCVPGAPLSDLEMDDALDVMIGLLPRLWKPAAAPFRTLADEAAWWSSYLPTKWERADRPFERSLLKSALSVMERLAPSQGEQVLLHQDLHADNVLSAQREPWLVIDPKPLVGEREFGIAALVRGGELGHSRSLLSHRFDRLTTELGLDRERARGWALAQTLAWAFEDDEVLGGMVEPARWLLDT